MSQEILQTLQEIRGLLYIFLYAGGFLLFIFIAKIIANTVIRIKQAFESAFVNEADKLMKMGKLPELIKHCEEKLKEYPNHSNAIWWLGKAKHEIGQKNEAKLLFERLLVLEPSWKNGYIDPYLEA